jgi:Sel1 repeat-containing protein
MKSTLWFTLFGFLLGTTLVSNCNSQDRYLDELRHKAETGDPGMQFWLGAYYRFPNVMKDHPDLASMAPNYAEAMKWLSKSAAQGRPEAMAELGEMYEGGEGVPKDETLAAVFYRMSCEARPDYQSTSSGCNNLAILYDEGRGVTQDAIEAYKYYVLAELPPDDLKQIGADLTPLQIAEAQRRIDVWRHRHPTDVQIWRRQTSGK